MSQYCVANHQECNHAHVEGDMKVLVQQNHVAWVVDADFWIGMANVHPSSFQKLYQVLR